MLGAARTVEKLTDAGENAIDEVTDTAKIVWAFILEVLAYDYSGKACYFARCIVKLFNQSTRAITKEYFRVVGAILKLAKQKSFCDSDVCLSGFNIIWPFVIGALLALVFYTLVLTPFKAYFFPQKQSATATTAAASNKKGNGSNGHSTATSPVLKKKDRIRFRPESGLFFAVLLALLLVPAITYIIFATDAVDATAEAATAGYGATSHAVNRAVDKAFDATTGAVDRAGSAADGVIDRAVDAVGEGYGATTDAVTDAFDDGLDFATTFLRRARHWLQTTTIHYDIYDTLENGCDAFVYHVKRIALKFAASVDAGLEVVESKALGLGLGGLGWWSSVTAYYDKIYGQDDDGSTTSSTINSNSGSGSSDYSDGDDVGDDGSIGFVFVPLTAYIPLFLVCLVSGKIAMFGAQLAIDYEEVMDERLSGMSMDEIMAGMDVDMNSGYERRRRGHHVWFTGRGPLGMAEGAHFPKYFMGLCSLLVCYLFVTNLAVGEIDEWIPLIGLTVFFGLLSHLGGGLSIDGETGEVRLSHHITGKRKVNRVVTSRGAHHHHHHGRRADRHHRKKKPSTSSAALAAISAPTSSSSSSTTTKHQKHQKQQHQKQQHGGNTSTSTSTSASASLSATPNQSNDVIATEQPPASSQSASSQSFSLTYDYHEEFNVLPVVACVSVLLFVCLLFEDRMVMTKSNIEDWSNLIIYTAMFGLLSRVGGIMQC